MNSINPFLFSRNPYRKNPFSILRVNPGMTQANIDQFASAREAVIAAGQQPDPDLQLREGECIHAAQCLQDPLLRLAFDLMTDRDEPSCQE